MPKPCKKTPITSRGLPQASSSKPAATRAVIRQFHVLLKKQAQLRDSQSDDATQKRELAQVEEGIEQLGGLDVYQRMSRIGQGKDRGGGSEKVLIGWLKEVGVQDSCRLNSTKIRLLEVGALKPDNFRDCASWINSTPIDLHSQHPSIAEQDFLQMDKADHCGTWSVISLSLVLNFTPQPKDRGRMLCLAHSMLTDGGYLFLVLPLPCVLNSRYMTFEHLKYLMAAIGFSEIKSRWKFGRKMAYWLYKKEKGKTDEGFGRKVVLRQGNRNNFAILLN